jgi:hypothetical protein
MTRMTGKKLNGVINPGLRAAETKAIFAKLGAEAKIESPRDFADFNCHPAPGVGGAGQGRTS